MSVSTGYASHAIAFSEISKLASPGRPGPVSLDSRNTSSGYNPILTITGLGGWVCASLLDPTRPTAWLA